MEKGQTENHQGEIRATVPTGKPPQVMAKAAAAAKSLQSCLTLCYPMDSSPPGSSVPGILQARTLEWVAISFSNACMHAKLLQLSPTLCDPMDSSPQGSSVHGTLQARILEWVFPPMDDGARGPEKVLISHVCALWC